MNYDHHLKAEAELFAARGFGKGKMSQQHKTLATNSIRYTAIADLTHFPRIHYLRKTHEFATAQTAADHLAEFERIAHRSIVAGKHP